MNETIGHYRILRLLGAGGMGEVYLASDLILDRHVAIKVVRPEILQDGAARARFLREARAVATLNHAGIAAIYEAGERARHARGDDQDHGFWACPAPAPDR